MITYLVRSVISGLVLLLAVTAIVFFAIYGTSTSVARNILGQSATQSQVDALNVKLGLNRPLFDQYGTWLTHAIRGDLGTSFFTGQSIATALVSRLPITFSVVLLALLITLTVSSVLGLAAAARGGVIDRVIQSAVTAFYVFPVIILAIGMVYVFAVLLHWLPAIGYVSFSQSPLSWLASITLPAVTLAVAGIAILTSQIRGAMIDELDRDYIRTLRSRGISERSIMYKHALRNAAAPALTTFSLLFIGLFAASFFIESVFGLPGFGQFSVTATTQGDFPAILGVTVVSTVLVVVVNILVDLALGLLNPKVRS